MAPGEHVRATLSAAIAGRGSGLAAADRLCHAGVDDPTELRWPAYSEAALGAGVRVTDRPARPVPLHARTDGDDHWRGSGAGSRAT